MNENSLKNSVLSFENDNLKVWVGVKKFYWSDEGEIVSIESIKKDFGELVAQQSEFFEDLFFTQLNELAIEEVMDKVKQAAIQSDEKISNAVLKIISEDENLLYKVCSELMLDVDI